MWQVIGQQKALTLLRRSLGTDSLSHAYLLVGPAHIGKMKLALNLAQALNCENNRNPDDNREIPCGECPACLKIASLKHADVQVLSMSEDATEENRAKISVTQIEDLQHSASLPPFEGRFKVFIIDAAEYLSIGAANRLLKTLEEPVDNVLFILLTVDEKLLPPTVVSRCQRIELSLVPAKEIEEALIKKWTVEPEKARLLSRLAHGCPGWAVAAALDDKLVQQRAEWLDKLLDTSDDLEERLTYAMQMAEQFSRHRGQVFDRIELWLDWWRDLMLVKTGIPDGVTNVDRLDALNAVSSGLSLFQIRAFIESLRSCGRQLRQNASPRLALEALMLDMPENKYSGIRNTA